MTTREIASYLKIHPLTVMRYARSGEIPAFKIGQRWRFYKKNIKKWLKGRISLEDGLRKKRDGSIFG
ncbi:MAG: helix-turn-helix domain-containing protein [Candidatus Omnitrophica bacterium]|nr:helix-turn-helix domain-containing protein [Candidatus Omnitrophota bacterium]